MIEIILKELYNNIEEKLACACLIHEDMKKISMNYIRWKNPRLSEIDIRKQVDKLLKKSYQENKEKQKNKSDVVKRPLKEVPRNQIVRDSSCASKCKAKKTNFKESVKDEYRNDSIDKRRTKTGTPLEKLIYTNKSFKLRMKQIDESEPASIRTIRHIKTSKSETRIVQTHNNPASITSPKKGIQVKLANTNARSEKFPQYIFCPAAEMNTTVCDDFKKLARDKEKKCAFCDENKANSKSRVSPSVASPNKGSQAKCVGTSAPSKKFSQYKFRPTMEMNTPDNFRKFSTDQQKKCVCREENKINSKTTRTKEVPKGNESSKVGVCNNHCIMCLLEMQMKPRIVICQKLCPNCDTSDAKAKDISKNSGSKVTVSSPKISKTLSDYKKKPFENVRVSKNISSRATKYSTVMEEEEEDKELNSQGSFEDNLDDFDTDICDYSEWDFAGLDSLVSHGPFKKNNIPVEAKWSDTVSALNKINSNHINPIKQELHDIQECFSIIKHKYNY